MKYDFHKISETEDVEVYQAMEKLETTVSEVTGEAPIKYTPQGVEEITSDVLEDALTLFEDYDIDAVTVSRQGGLTVRVSRNKTNPYEYVEPNVQRLKSAGKEVSNEEEL